jgi:two-component system response regulator DevR
MKSPAAPIRLVIVDDSGLVRAGLRALLEDVPGLRLAGEAGTAAAALEVCGRERPDVVLLDLRLPDGTGLEVCRQLQKLRPDTRVVFLTSTDDEQTVDEAIRAGAHGYLLKDINGPGLVQAIRATAAGQSTLDPLITARVLNIMRTAGGPATLKTLSPQEHRVLALIAEGRTNKEAGAELGLAEKTVKNYLSNIFEKLHVTRRAQAAALYARDQPPPKPR